MAAIFGKNFPHFLNFSHSLDTKIPVKRRPREGLPSWKEAWFAHPGGAVSNVQCRHLCRWMLLWELPNGGKALQNPLAASETGQGILSGGAGEKCCSLAELPQGDHAVPSPCCQHAHKHAQTHQTRCCKNWHPTGRFAHTTRPTPPH